MALVKEENPQPKQAATERAPVAKAEVDAKPTSCFMPNGHPGYLAMQGTSMSAPLVAGVVACMLEANPFLGPKEVKEILQRTARKLEGWDEYAQGAGVMNADAAIMEAARRNPQITAAPFV